MQVYRNPKVQVQKSQSHGVGNIALEPISKGEIIWVRVGHIVDKETAFKSVEDFGYYILQITEGHYLAPLSEQDVKEMSMYNNHSCEPNVGVMGQICFVAMRDIAMGEELLIDYGMVVSHEFEMQCHCGSALCRNVITGDDWQLPELQERYRGFFSSYLEQKMGD